MAVEKNPPTELIIQNLFEYKEKIDLKENKIRENDTVELVNLKWHER